MAKYLSNRQRNLKVGIVSYTESNTVLEVTGKVGIGTTNATTNLDVNGGLRVRGSLYDNNNSAGSYTYVPVADNAGGWSWQPVTASGAGTLNGIIVQEEGGVVGSSGSITTLDFRGNNIIASATVGGAIATITVSDTPTFDNLTVSGISSLSNTNVSGFLTGTNAYFSGNVSIGGTLTYEDVTNVDAIGLVTARSGIEIGSVSIGATLSSTGDASFAGVVTATSFSGSGTNLSGIVTSIVAGTGVTINQATGSVIISASVGSGLSETAASRNYIVTLSPSFNGVTTSFTLRYEGNDYYAQNSQQLIVSLGGVIQEPDVAYTVSGPTLSFASAPSTETDYFIVALNSISLTRNRQTYNVTGVQTSFTLTSGYTVGYVDVYLNGSRLITGDDYTATNGTTVGLTSAAQNGDVVEIIGFKTLVLTSGDIETGSLLVTGVSTLGTVKVSSGIITATSGIVTYYGDGSNLTGVLATYATSAGIATYATTAGVATALQNSRTFEITGDIVASPISFNGTGNVSLAATIQPNSVALGSDTTGDYVQSISGTANQITVSSGTGEGSTPIVSISTNPTIPGNVTIGNDLQVNNNLNVTGNITVGGTTAYIIADDFVVKDADIILGFTTNLSGQDASNDTTANHGGIAIASTEGYPLVDLFISGIETAPTTYKKIMWFKAGSFAGLNTDAWLSNYAIGIGSTQVPDGVRLAVGGVHVTDNQITATTFSGNATSATYATSSGIATYADTAGIATYASSAGVATNVSGGTASVTSLDVSGITTLGTVEISSGIITATSGIVTYYGDGSKLSNVISGVGIQSAGTTIGYGFTTLNFVGSGNTFVANGSTIDISISAGAGGTWGTYTAGIATNKSVGVNTSTVDDPDLTGIGNSFQGLYVSNGMIIVDNVLSGNHYIGTNFNGLMAGPVTITGSLTVDGNYVVV